MGKNWIALISLLGIWLLLMALPADAAPVTAQASNLRLGVNMHPLQEAYAPSQVAQQVALAQSVRAEVIRIDIHWAWIEPTEPGSSHWNQSQLDLLDAFLAAMATRNIDVLATVMDAPCWASSDPTKSCATLDYDWHYPPRDPQEYATFAGELVKRYKSKIRYWEIWNEPNFAGFWANPDPGVYTALLKAAHQQIKANDPSAVVIAGALAPCEGPPDCPVSAVGYLEAMYAAGAKGFFDKLSYHPYTDGNTPTWYDARWPMHGYSSSVPAVRQVMQRYGDTSPIWLTELGWTTVPADGSCDDCWTPTLPKTEAEQAAYLASAIQIARGWSYVEALLWYELVDMVQPWDPAVVSFEHYFGLFRKDYSPKPAAGQFRDLTIKKVFLPTIVLLPADGPFRLHQVTTIGTGQTAQGSFSDGMEPYSEDWLWRNNHFRIQRIRREENSSGCAAATYDANKVWLSVGAPATLSINGAAVGTVTNITAKQQHGYIVNLTVHAGDTLCVSPIPSSGFHIIFGPDLYYHYDSYCYRGYC